MDDGEEPSMSLSGSGADANLTQSQADVATHAPSVAKDAKLFRRLDFSEIADVTDVRDCAPVPRSLSPLPVQCCAVLCSVVQCEAMVAWVLVFLFIAWRVSLSCVQRAEDEVVKELSAEISELTATLAASQPNMKAVERYKEASDRLADKDAEWKRLRDAKAQKADEFAKVKEAR
jgi:hypothetical protein